MKFIEDIIINKISRVEIISTMSLKIRILIVILFCFIPGILKCQSYEGSGIDKLIDDTKKTVVFLGSQSEEKDTVKINPYATGFLVRIENIYHLVTAKHVVMENQNGVFTGRLIDQNLYAFLNLNVGAIHSRSIQSIKDMFRVNWVFHEKDFVDIAIIPFAIDPEKEDIKVIPESWFLNTDRLFELYDIFFLSYQPGIEPENKIEPIIRSGTISILNSDKTFYIDAFAFPGNSGSPVFLKHSLIRFDKSGIQLGGDELGGKFIGIIGEYVTYKEIAYSMQTKRPRIVFEENTGLSKVWSISFIKEIIESERFKEQMNKLQK